MARIEKLEALVEKLRTKAAESRKEDDCSVSVGYTQNYAIYVHENTQAYHPTGQAKFLEQPARQNSKKIAQMVVDCKRRGMTTAQALVMAGLYLQRESQKLCPVDSGALRASAFTKLDTKGI